MSRLSFLVVAMCAVLFVPHGGRAQSAGRVPVRGGEIQGLELGLEGALSAPRGGTLRWLLALYEVIGTSDLRLAPGAEVQLTTALDPSAAPIVARADEHGRVALDIAIPDDAPDTFPVVLRALSRGVIRRFELVVRVEEPRAIAIWVARERVLEGGPVHTFGRLWDRTTGHPIARDEVRLTARDHAGRPVATPVRVRADESGLFAHVFRLRRDVEGGITITASAERDDRTVEAVTSTWIGEPEGPELILAVAPERSIVAPDEDVPVDVVLRTAEGRPVPGAMVELSNIDHRDASRRALTDARGRARFTWRVPRTGAPIRDLVLQASATREGLGSASGTAPVRVATVDHAASVSVEGGALIPSIGGRVWVRVVGLDGRPAGAGVPVQLGGARLGAAQRSTTDASGVARFDVRVAPASADPAPRCGGEGQASASIQVGDGARAYSLESCLPLDGDGTARVRADVARVRSGTSVRLEVERAIEVARAPVWISLLAIGPSGPRALGSHVLAPNETRAQLPIPVDAVGTILVRARPIGPGGRELRGGSALVWSEPGVPIAIEAALDPAGVRIERRAPSPHAQPEVPAMIGSLTPVVSAWAIALPIDEARALADRVAQSALGPLASLRTGDANASDALIEGALAAATPLDTAAPWVLRGNTPIAVPAPRDPTQAGLLRDPWRAQSRFLTGRLALVFSAIERHVAAAVPGRIDDVAVQTGARWDFNAQILTAIGGSGDLGAEGATGLGGDPLTIEQLRRVDPTFTYDRVAARITRERLYRLLVALRRFVQQNAFDLPWARVGDPSTWLRHLPNTYIQGVGPVQARELVDAWGRPFVLRRVMGRARFAAWAPLDGWELFSSGPDGRPGNGDDVADPTARVLPAGSAYAEAVGEDWLLARLRGVELGRATVDLLQQSGAISVPVGGVPDQPDVAAQHHSMQLWTALPPELRGTPDPLALRRPAQPGEGAGGRLVPLREGTTAIDLSRELDEEPREWGAFVAAFSQEGRVALAEARARLGSPLIVEARLPARLRVSEPAELSLFVTNASDVDRRLAIEVRAEGPLSGRASELTLRAGTSERVSLVLEASDVGPARASIVLLESSEPVRTVSWRTTIDAGLHPTRTRAATALSGEEWRTTLEIPADAARPSARIVLMQPSALHRDPDLADARERDPAIVAWAATLAGAPLDAELRAHLLGAQEHDGSFRGTDPAVSTACAVIALSAIAEDDPEAASAAARARGALLRMGGEVTTWSQQLAALAGTGAPELADLEERDVDPVSAHTSALRTALRRALRSAPDEPSLLARMSAALLLADPRDAYGRVMFERARAHLEEVRSGGGLRVRPAEARDTGAESLSATLALSIAAHQLGETELARRLAAGAIDRDHVITRTAGEPLFWLLAAASYGVLGAGEPPALTLEAGGRSRPIDFVAGVALVPLEGLRAGERVDVRLRRNGPGPAILARAELVLEQPFRDTQGDALELELNGDPGDVDGVAALELTVRARRALRAGVVVDVQLPAGVSIDDELERALQSAGAIRVERRAPGLLRIVLGPLESGVAAVLPLPLRWSVRGQLRGLGVVAHPADIPGQMSILPPRVLSIAPARDLE